MDLFLGRRQTEKFVTDKNSCVQRFFVVWPWVRVVSLAWRCAVTWHPCHHYILDPHINSAREGQINSGRSCVYVAFNVRERKKERFMCLWSVWCVRSRVCRCVGVGVCVEIRVPARDCLWMTRSVYISKIQKNFRPRRKWRNTLRVLFRAIKSDPII